MINTQGNPASLRKVIAKEKIFDPETIALFQVSDITWLMSIKPKIRNVTPYANGRVRLEEIEVFSLRINAPPETRGYLSLLSQIHSKVMYPCVVFLEYLGKYKIAAWKAIDSVNLPNREILKSAYVSSWIHDPPSSSKTEYCMKTVEELLLNGEGNIRGIYDQICNAILGCQPQYIGSKKHMLTILYDLCGKKNSSFIGKIDGTRKYTVKKPVDKYKKKEYESSYVYFYEYEDIWYALMNDDGFRKMIEKRRYSSVEEMIYRIDEKYRETF